MPRRKKVVEEVLAAEQTCEGMANPFGERVCEFSRGDRVLVHGGTEDTPDDFFGQVLYHKWSNISGWWVDVKRDDTDRTYNIPVEFVEAIDTVGVE